MPNTYEKIATQTLTSGNPNITFSNISSAFTDLVLIGSLQTESAGAVRARFNGDTGTNYEIMYQSTTSSPGAIQGAFDTAVNGFYLSWHGASPATSWCGLVWHIFNYSNTSTYKSALNRFGGANEASFHVHNWKSTNAINQIDIINASGVNYIAGSTLTLYGIKAA